MAAPNTQPTPKPERHTWISLALGSAVWFLHLNVAYGLASLSCFWGWLTEPIAGVSSLLVLETILTALALALMAYSIYLPWRDWRQYQTEKPAKNPRLLDDSEKDRRPMVAFMTLLLNGLLFLFVIAAFVPIWTLNPCS
jgi:hypothetical protein